MICNSLILSKKNSDDHLTFKLNGSTYLNESSDVNYVTSARHQIIFVIAKKFPFHVTKNSVKKFSKTNFDAFEYSKCKGRFMD